MPRHEWKFSVLAEKIGAAATKRREHHRERIAWWQDQREKADAELRMRGTEYREQPITGGARLEIHHDQTLVARVNECIQKISHHQAAAESYDAYVRACAAQPEKLLELTAEDFTYFDL